MKDELVAGLRGLPMLITTAVVAAVVVVVVVTGEDEPASPSVPAVELSTMLPERNGAAPSSTSGPSMPAPLQETSASPTMDGGAQVVSPAPVPATQPPPAPAGADDDDGSDDEEADDGPGDDGGDDRVP